MRKIKNIKWVEKVPIVKKDKEGNDTDEFELDGNGEPKVKKTDVELGTVLGNLFLSTIRIPRNKVKEMVESKELNEKQKVVIENLPTGFDLNMLENTITTAFSRAKNDGRIVLEEDPYKTLREIVQEFIPPGWGSNLDVFNAVKTFMVVVRVPAFSVSAVPLRSIVLDSKSSPLPLASVP